jgi:hypothetical protein
MMVTTVTTVTTVMSTVTMVTMVTTVMMVMMMTEIQMAEMEATKMAMVRVVKIMNLIECGEGVEDFLINESGLLPSAALDPFDECFYPGGALDVGKDIYEQESMRPQFLPLGHNNSQGM